MKDKTITIVSGLPRSGTSMMMEMLDKGGLEVLTDKMREPDEDNPKGYYEYERVKKLPEDIGWLDDAKGKAVKVLGELIKHVPKGYEYKIIFMEREIDEVVESQEKMLERKGRDTSDYSKEEMKQTLIEYSRILKNQMKNRPDMDVLYVSYNDIMSFPEPVVESVSVFLDGNLDTNEMLKVIDGDLYRNRSL